MVRALAKEQAGEQSVNGTFSDIHVPCFGDEKRSSASKRTGSQKKRKIKKLILTTYDSMVMRCEEVGVLKRIVIDEIRNNSYAIPAVVNTPVYLAIP